MPGARLGDVYGHDLNPHTSRSDGRSLRPTWSGIIHQVRRRWRYKLAAARRGRRARPRRRWRCCCPRGASSRGDSARPRSSPSASCLAWRSPALLGWFIVRPLMRRVLRRTGRAVSRRARAVAAGRDHQRDRGRAGWPSRAVAAFGGARAAAGPVGRREMPGDRWGTHVERPPLRRHAATLGRDCRRRARALHARAALPAARAVGALRRVAQRRGRGAVSDRRHARATPACRGASIRPSPRRSPGSMPIRRR